MNDNDMANMIKKAQEMINNNQIPDELKNLVANMQNNGSNNSNNMQNNGFNSSNNMQNNSFNNSNNMQNSYNNHNNMRNSNNIYNTSSKSNMKQDYNKYSSTYSRGNNNYNVNSRINNNTQNNQENNATENSNSSGIDIETMMKLQNIMSKMKSFNNDDDMSKLLLSLKPYLRNEKKEKVDEYIKLIKMGKMTQAFDLFGGDKP